MALKRNQKITGEILVETEFLFSLREGNSRYGVALKILKASQQGKLKVEVPSSAVMEAITVLYSYGFNHKQVEEILTLIDAKLIEAGISYYIPLTLTDVVIAARLRAELPQLSFYDSLHAAIAKRTNKYLLSSDPVYKEAGLRVISFEEISNIL